jgi:hypothetical protein
VSAKCSKLSSWLLCTSHDSSAGPAGQKTHIQQAMCNRFAATKRGSVHERMLRMLVLLLLVSIHCPGG